MAERPARRLFPNPFYVLLLAASVLFVLTILGYLAVPSVLAQANEPERVTAGAVRLLDAFNRRAPMILAVECGVMIASGLLAMATDRWFGAPKPKP
jgi:hypothetical protein